ncbi:MAG: GNAT family N-acetyltransferase [Myxococcota bacterium]
MSAPIDPTPPTIRFATPGDAPTLLSFIRALAEYEREPAAVEVDEPTLRAQLGADPPPFECLIASLEDVPVGISLFFHNYSTWRGRRGLHLEDLFVLPEHRGRGVGFALLKELARLAVERDCARMEWAVLTWNEPAIRFYESLGANIMDGWRTFRLTDDALQRLAQ